MEGNSAARWASALWHSRPLSCDQLDMTRLLSPTRPVALQLPSAPALGHTRERRAHGCQRHGGWTSRAGRSEAHGGWTRRVGSAERAHPTARLALTARALLNDPPSVEAAADESWARSRACRSRSACFVCSCSARRATHRRAPSADPTRLEFCDVRWVGRWGRRGSEKGGEGHGRDPKTLREGQGSWRKAMEAGGRPWKLGGSHGSPPGTR